MKRVLVLLSSSFPFGQGETFLAAEFPALEEAFDEIIVISNDVSSAQTWATGPKVSCERISYELSSFEKAMALQGLFSPVVWRELVATRTLYPRAPALRLLSTTLTTWAKAKKVAGEIARIASSRPGMGLYGYSYWANDMAVAVALARGLGTVCRATSRAHGWDVYTSRSEGGFLPFRGYLAENLDSLLFVSADGRKFFESTVGRGRAALEVLALGTPRLADGPLGRAEPFTIVSCSRLIPLKRVDLLATALVGSARPIRWVHIGDGPERPRVEAICAGLPRGVEVVLTGDLPHGRVIETLRSLRPSALVNLSSSEGVPVSMMEAMSLGIPVIGTGVGGVPEIVRDGVNGYLLSATPTLQEIADAIGRVADLPEAAFRALSEGAWRTWHDRFQADANFKRLIDHMLAPPAGEEASWPRTTRSAEA